MDFTGERYIPGLHGNIELEHMHRYLLACEIAANKIVLDIACGEGYGAALLAQTAKQVIGVDISEMAITRAQDRYVKDNLKFKVGDCIDIPLQENSVDLVVSFETIEHITQHDQMMNEIKRVLKSEGLLMISSPDKQMYSIEPGYTNPFHIKELTDIEFKQLLVKYFTNISCFGQRVLYGSHIVPDTLSAKTKSFIQNQDKFNSIPGILKPIYWIALASDAQLPTLPSSVYEQPVNESEAVLGWMKLAEERNKRVYEVENEVLQYATSKSWRWTRIFRILIRAVKQLRGRT